MSFLEIPRIINTIFSADEDTNWGRIPYYTVDYDKEKESYFLRIEIPGTAKEDIKLDASDNKIFLSTKKTAENEDDKKDHDYYEKEFFFRHKIKADSITAKYENGVLEISVVRDLPKKVKVQIS